MKKLIALTTLGILATPLVLLTLPSNAQPGVNPDFNDDGCVDRSDYDILMAEIRARNDYDAAYDLNGDGVVSRADARTMLSSFDQPRGAACPQAPNVSWSEDKIAQSLAIETSASVEVSLTSDRELQDVAFEVSEELIDLVTVSPNQLANVAANAETLITVTIQATEFVEAGAFKGVLAAELEGTPLESTLPITVTATQLYEHDLAGFTFSIETPFNQAEFDPISPAVDFQELVPLQNGPSLFIVTYPNDDLEPIADWYASTLDGAEFSLEDPGTKSVSEIVIGSNSFLSVESDVMELTMLRYFVALGGNVIEISTSFPNTSAPPAYFFDALESLSF